MSIRQKVQSNETKIGNNETSITEIVNGTTVVGKATADSAGNTITATYEAKANKGKANGYASLGSNGKVPSSQLPTTIQVNVPIIIGRSNTSAVNQWKTFIGATFEALNPNFGIEFFVRKLGQGPNEVLKFSSSIGAYYYVSRGTINVEIEDLSGWNNGDYELGYNRIA